MEITIGAPQITGVEQSFRDLPIGTMFGYGSDINVADRYEKGCIHVKLNNNISRNCLEISEGGRRVVDFAMERPFYFFKATIEKIALDPMPLKKSNES